ncbi:MAG: alpha-ribazole phosphatase family protein [Ferruginibacter sp.]
MEIYLIRHTAPDIAKGVCYGQADVDVTGSFLTEAAVIKQYLPKNVTAVYSSPLQRCKKLAAHLFAGHKIHLHDELKEINCGRWELKLWDAIPKDEIDPWIGNLEIRIPGGESYTEVFQRAATCFDKIIDLHRPGNPQSPTGGLPEGVPGLVIVAHGGVIRSILSHITHTPLHDSFKVFSLHYGCVIKIIQQQNSLLHEVLSNIPQETETHKPSNL